MIRLSAPYPTIETEMVLPNPAFGDSEAPRDTVKIRRMMDGTVFSYVRRTGGRRQLQYDFSLSRMKALELIAFIRSYYSSKVRLIDHLGKIWVGNFTANPMEFETTSRDRNKPGGAKVTVKLEFEGVEQ